MKESYGEDLANHSGPESYAGDGNKAGVATAGVQSGQLLSFEMVFRFACRHSGGCWKATRTIALLASGRATRRSRRTCA